MKNQLIALLICLTIASSSLYSQANNISTTSKWGQQIFLSDVNGRAFENKYADVSGSAYLYPNFKFATIVLKDGRTYNNVQARLNLVEHEVNFIASNGEQGYIGKGMVTSILFNDTSKDGVNTYIFQTGFSPIDNQSAIHFYQVLVNGKISLLKSINKNIEDFNNTIINQDFCNKNKFAFSSNG